MQSVGTFLPSTAVRSVGVLIDHPPAATPPVTTGDSRYTIMSCLSCQGFALMPAPPTWTSHAHVNPCACKQKGLEGLWESCACAAAEAQCTASQGRRRRGLT